MDTSQSTKKTIEKTSARKQAEIHSTSTQPTKPPVIDLEKLWEHFNKNLHTKK